MDDYIGGKRVVKSLSKDKALATKIRDDLLRNRDLSRFGIAPDNYPLPDIKDKFLRELKPRVSRTTYEGYITMLSRALEFIGVDTPLHQIRHRFNEYTDARKKEGISDHTMNVTLGLLKRMLAYGVQTNLIPFNPMADVPKLKERKRLRRALRPEEIKALLKHSGKWRQIWLTFILTGLRRSELVRLRVKHIDRKACTLIVAESKTDAGVRAVHLHRTLQKALWPLLKNKRPEDYVFTTPHGTPLKNNLLRAFRVCLKRAEIDQEGVDLHSLRKTFASLLASADAHQKKAAVLMGHRRTSTTTDIYTDTYPEDLREAVEKIQL